MSKCPSVIPYSPTSHFHLNLDKAKKGEIPWYQVLSQPGFKFGRTDPELDPKGYYMIIAAKLANIYLKDQTIKQRILGEDRNPKQIFPEETLTTTLETGQLDAMAAYKHEAIAKGLSYITLPSQINLANLTSSNPVRFDHGPVSPSRTTFAWIRPGRFEHISSAVRP